MWIYLRKFIFLTSGFVAMTAAYSLLLVLASCLASDGLQVLLLQSGGSWLPLLSDDEVDNAEEDLLLDGAEDSSEDNL